MARREYDSPVLKMMMLSDEDIITSSVYEDEDGNKQAVGSFDNSWLGNG